MSFAADYSRTGRFGSLETEFFLRYFGIPFFQICLKSDALVTSSNSKIQNPSNAPEILRLKHKSDLPQSCEYTMEFFKFGNLRFFSVSDLYWMISIIMSLNFGLMYGLKLINVKSTIKSRYNGLSI